jgi:hypothetical protein
MMDALVGAGRVTLSGPHCVHDSDTVASMAACFLKSMRTHIVAAEGKGKYYKSHASHISVNSFSNYFKKLSHTSQSSKPKKFS